METATQSPAQILPMVEAATNGSGLFSSESVLNILKLILAGSPLSEVLTIIARLVESQGQGILCTIWLPDEDGKQLHCAAAETKMLGCEREADSHLARERDRVSGEQPCL